MSKIVIVVNAEVKEAGKVIPASPATERMVAAVKRAITKNSVKPVQIQVIPVASLWSDSSLLGSEKQDLIYCPLTIELPNNFDFPGKSIYQACRNIQARRQWVENNLNYKTSLDHNWLGDLWLPIIMTEKGPLYGEVIGEGVMPNFYQQPIDLPDKQRQPLYHLAYQLLTNLAAPPAVYLLQFGLQDQEIIFDRLWPFPAAPAIASIGIQQPDLFTCHWYCLTGKPIVDVTILCQ
jgi:hypothetical protein